MNKNRLFLSLFILLTVVGLIAMTFYLYLAGTQKVPPIIDTLSLEKKPESDKKVGGLFMIGHWANTPTASTTELISKYQLGGVIIMSVPENVSEIKAWVTEWNSVSQKPLFIAIDQEGGPVTRIKSSEFIQTGQRDITDAPTAYDVGKQRGQELAELGINMNFAPVLDTAINPESFMYSRTFPVNATTLAVAMANGLRAGGIIAVAKHFPGHDDTSDDSHLTLPTVALEKSELDTFTGPFATYIEATQPLALMTAHVLFPKIDDVPATLSSFFLSEYLRGKLKFTGLIITDDMSMDAIDNTFTAGEASLLSLEAGADMVLLAAEPTAIAEAFPIVETGISSRSYARALQQNDTLRALIPAD